MKIKPQTFRLSALTHYHSCNKTKNIFLCFFPSLKPTIFFIIFTKHDTINIGHLSSMQDVCHNHMNFVMSLALEFLWLSGKASEHRVCTIYPLFKGNGSQIEVDCGSGQWPFLQYVVSSYNPWRYNFLRNLMSIKVCTRSQHQRKTPLLWMTALTSFCLKKNLEQTTHGELNLYFLNSKSACFAVLLGTNILILIYLKVYFIHRTTFSSEKNLTSGHFLNSHFVVKELFGNSLLRIHRYNLLCNQNRHCKHPFQPLLFPIKIVFARET